MFKENILIKAFVISLLGLLGCTPAYAEEASEAPKVFQGTSPLVCSDRAYIEDSLKNKGLQPAIRGIVQGEEWMMTLWVNEHTHEWASTVLNKDGKTECLGAIGGNILSVPMAKQEEASD